MQILEGYAVFAYVARRYNSAAESTSLLSSAASLAIKAVKTNLFCIIQFHYSFELSATDSSGKWREINKISYESNMNKIYELSLVFMHLNRNMNTVFYSDIAVSYG